VNEAQTAVTAVTPIAAPTARHASKHAADDDRPMTLTPDSNLPTDVARPSVENPSREARRSATSSACGRRPAHPGQAVVGGPVAGTTRVKAK